MGIWEKLGFKKEESLKTGLEKSRTGLLGKITKAVAGKDTIDEDVLDELEEALITSDVGVPTTLQIIRRIEARVKKDTFLNSAELQHLLRDEIVSMLREHDNTRPVDFDAPLPQKPHVILVVGVNGVGKTTTIGKMANLYKLAGKSVILGAADTFRAAAVNQLTIWSERAGVPIVQQGQGADPAAVAYDTVASAQSRGTDVAIIDTAGRLHNKTALMDELHKIRRVMGKIVEGAPHETLLILDGSTGQNALQQARAFTQAAAITGLVVTKLDGTAKGGIVIGISSELNIPVKYIGVGEKIEDLQPFDRASFVNALLN